ncbi:hypothetical protein GQ53DRAFT_796617 [Thozetella sp. PMI_491]|nr:hypothetical protein GQ53DRAFT_796617 [Thozetella sp. PMI_491]
MASKGQKKPSQFCVGAPEFVPDQRIADASARDRALELLEKNDLKGAIESWFMIPSTSQYIYHAIGSVVLDQVQKAVEAGGVNGLHAWYRSETGETLQPPPRADIDAYIAIFLPSTSTASSLKGFISNAKKGSIRQETAKYLQAKRFIHPSLSQLANLPKAKKAPPNLYFDFWAWSCRNLEYCGPIPGIETSQKAHHVLPIFMHHWGCAVPSHEALTILKSVAQDRVIADIGSGGGYWTFLLRQYGARVLPVDNAQSAWRVTWVEDTVIADGAKWLSRKENANGKDMVVLVVYPIVGGGVSGGVEGGFTRGLLEAYKGDTLAVVGTDNRSGYTSFKDMTMDEYMGKEQPDWIKVAQVSLPSFPGKSEALFIFQRGERAPSKD